MKNELIDAVSAVRQRYPRVDLFDRDTFIANLTFVHGMIAASENLLAVAAAKSTDDLREYYETHLAEEQGHAKWLADDLCAVGVEVDALSPWDEAVQMAGSQYYLIYHVDAAALLGYMATLECFPMSVADVVRLERAHGASLCRTLRHHALHDSDHGSDVLSQIEKLDRRRFDLVLKNALQTAGFLHRAISKMEGGSPCTA